MIPSYKPDLDCICIPILANHHYHHSVGEVLAVFIRYIDGSEALINFRHQDGLSSNVSFDDFAVTPNSLVYNKKVFLSNGKDIGIDLNSFLHYFDEEIVDFNTIYDGLHIKQFNSFRGSPILGQIIPLSIHELLCSEITSAVIPIYESNVVTDECKNYCNDFCNTFHSLDMTHVIMNSQPRLQNYMWYTLTSRPSNACDGINFSALNKKTGIRNSITSTFEDGLLVQYDFDAFHVKLLSNILNFQWSDHPYNELIQYTGQAITYDEVKSKVFIELYGNGAKTELSHHPFFTLVRSMVSSLYEQYIRNGFIGSHFYGKRFRHIDDITPYKLFNYYLQSLETEYNIQVIGKIYKFLKSTAQTTAYRSKFCMYIYDAFIFDIPRDETHLIAEIRNIFEVDGMSVKVSVGETFGSLLPA